MPSDRYGKSCVTPTRRRAATSSSGKEMPRNPAQSCRSSRHNALACRSPIRNSQPCCRGSAPRRLRQAPASEKRRHTGYHQGEDGIQEYSVKSSCPADRSHRRAEALNAAEIEKIRTDQDAQAPSYIGERGGSVPGE